ncbi:hypothetical protein FAES_3219 [Fibrella aestuarina BUZ 2]|uniref:Uncharacterized protein n=1 Tax=Fibrella aestuarina BUZ 2 TaxID=1166018 RepID=I0KAS5_9BACT|nr:hypothetical protein [Fibrella aestuarina]CCH01228.1 hypothetical protein FAES_3219 [Fibrella aestuarina BUZ 2]
MSRRHRKSNRREPASAPSGCGGYWLTDQFAPACRECLRFVKPARAETIGQTVDVLASACASSGQYAFQLTVRDEGAQAYRLGQASPDITLPKTGDDSTYLTQTGVLDRKGWTGAMLKTFMAVPCKFRRNPHYKSGHAVKLFSLTRILEIEATELWQQAAAGAITRSKRAQTGVQTKRARLTEYLENLVIEVPSIDRQVLIEAACAHFNKRQDAKCWRGYERGRDVEWEWEPATSDSDWPFLQRITTNYLRHELTHYHHELNRLYGKVDADQSADRLKERVNEAIWKAYPFLSPL